MPAQPGPDGVLNLLKPPGMTSHDVVHFVRRTVGTRRVGHTGTLDPGAAGVLPVCLGRATRLAEYIAGADKAYRAEFTFGIATDSLDFSGREVERRPAPWLDAAAVRAALVPFIGPILQVPPMVSAVKVGGRRLHELARAGRTVPREARPVTVHAMELLAFGAGDFPRAYLDVVCSKGTYIRALADDLGRALGTCCHLSFLVRTRAGAFCLEDCVTLEELAAAAPDVAPLLLAPADAVAHLPRLVVAPEHARRIGHGVALPLDGPAPAPPGVALALVDGAGNLLAVGTVDAPGERVLLTKVLA